MNIKASGIDYRQNTVEMREKLSFDSEKTAEIYKRIMQNKEITGCVIISTCNRTEIFISHTDNFKEKPSDILLRASHREDFKGRFHHYEGRKAVRYIIEVACGLHSQIIGESQIIGQINKAVSFSAKNGYSDCFLNKLFQLAVTAGKNMQTNAKITPVPVSSAYGAIELLKRESSDLCGKKVLVVGNGKMGRLAQKLLLENGCKVWITLREYKNGNNDVLKGCKTVLYSKRYETMENCFAVISATTSPHYTITKAELEKLKAVPEIMLDLAVPKDIEIDCGELTRCFNLDDMTIGYSIDESKLTAVKAIVERYIGEFKKWYSYKLSLGIINDIEKTISSRIDRGKYASVVKKTVEILIGSMNDEISPKKLIKYSEKIKKRTRL